MGTLKKSVFASIALGFMLCPCAASANVPVMPPGKCGPLPFTAQALSTEQTDVYVERDISVDELPQPVYAAFMGLGQDIRVLQVEEKVDEGGVTYEFELVHGDAYYEVEMDSAGNVIGSELEAWIVPLASLTEPARRIIEGEALGGSILEVRQEAEAEEGYVVYEADIQNGGRVYALRIDERGGLVERDITLEMLPRGAYLALVCAAQGGSIVELDEEVHEGRVSYDANIVLGDMEIDITVDSNGVVIELQL